MVSLRGAGLATRIGLLVGAVALALAVVASIAWPIGGGRAVLAAAVPAAVCLSGAVVALIAVSICQRREEPLLGTLCGMLPRMGLPLGFAVMTKFLFKGLVEFGVLYYLVGFYLVTLGIETVLSLPVAATPGRFPDAAEDVS